MTERQAWLMLATAYERRLTVCVYNSMKRKIERVLARKKRTFLWPIDKEHAKKRAALCRRFAKQCTTKKKSSKSD